MQTMIANPVLKPAVRGSVSRQTAVSVSARAAVQAKAKGKAEAMVCLDCGYLYDGKEPFDSLKSYSCPVCNAPKRRFKAFKGNAKNLSLPARRDKLREQIVEAGGNPDEGGDELLLIAGATIVATLGYFAYLQL